MGKSRPGSASSAATSTTASSASTAGSSFRATVEGPAKEVRLCLLCDRVFRAPKDAAVVDCPTCLSRLPVPGRDESHVDELEALSRQVPELRKQREAAAKMAMASASRGRSTLPPLPPLPR